MVLRIGFDVKLAFSFVSEVSDHHQFLMGPIRMTIADAISQRLSITISITISNLHGGVPLRVLVGAGWIVPKNIENIDS